MPLANPLSKEDFAGGRVMSHRSPPRRFLHLWHLASFDAPTVAIVWALAFAQTAGVHLEPWIAPLLFAGTWTVYVGDRLLDAHRAIPFGHFETLRERHFFHWRHRRALIPLAACSAAVAAGLIMHRMPSIVRERNSVLAAAALVYFSGVHSSPRLPNWMRRIGSKELLVGVIFTAGCAAPTLSQMHFADMRIDGMWSWPASFLYFALLAWCNCHAIACWESTPAKRVSWQAGMLTIAGIVILALLAFAHRGGWELVAAGAASSFLLLLLDHRRSTFSPLSLRVLSDLVLLTPAFLLALGRPSA